MDARRPERPHRRSPALAATGLAAALLLLAGDARGQPRVVVTAPELAGDLAPEAAAPILEALRAGLGATVFDLVTPETAADLEVDAVVRLSATQAGQVYSFEAALLAGPDGPELRALVEECAVCTWEEAMEAVERLGRELGAALPATLVVTVAPEGATVTVDGEPAEAAARLSLAAGPHRVEATLEGHEAASREVELRPGERSEVALALAPMAPPPPEEPPEPPEEGGGASGTLTLWGWLTAGAALAALVPGVLWLALEGQCVIGGNETEDGICTRVYYTWPQGLAVTAVGVGLAATSITLFVLGSRRRPAASRGAALALLPGPSGAMGLVVGRF